MDYLFAWLPALVTLPVVLTGMRKKRFAIPLIVTLYFLTLLVSIFMPHLLKMAKTGQGDPELVAGAIAQDLVSGFLATIIILPVLFLVWFLIRRAKSKKNA